MMNTPRFTGPAIETLIANAIALSVSHPHISANRYLMAVHDTAIAKGHVTNGTPFIRLSDVQEAYHALTHGNTCSECNAQATELIECPDGAELCRPCFNQGAH